jgi:hypothetical protein
MDKRNRKSNRQGNTPQLLEDNVQTETDDVGKRSG